MIFGGLIIICYLCIAEEKVDDGFMPMTPKSLMGLRTPSDFAEEKSGLRICPIFSKCQAF